jgi:pimeloyl-ACP methyl ester carboxylesterase
LSQLIFSIPNLITTISAGQTIQHGDVIATGTPAGVGFGQKPPVFLNHGDVVEVEVTGLGVLRNKISSDSPLTVRHLDMLTHSVRSLSGNLKELPSGKLVHVEEQGDSRSSDVIVFVHGLGASISYYHPVLSAASFSGLSSKRLVLYDLEGHGLSPTNPTSSVNIASYAADLKELISTLGVSSDSISIVGHSMGCFVILEYASQNQVKDIVLIGPPPIPLPQLGVEASLKRADTVRANGMAQVAKTVAATATSQRSKVANPLAVGYVHTLLLANDPEGYAKGCTALAGTAARPVNIDCLKISGKKVLLTGDEDFVAPVAKVQDLSRRIGGESRVLSGVGHWHALEDVAGVAKMLVDTL